MSWNWQDLCALSIVSIAVCYVAWLVYGRLRRRESRGCGGGCFGCTQGDPDANELVTSIGTSDALGKPMPRVE